MLISRIVFAQVLGIVASVAVVTSALAEVTVYQQCQKAKILARGKWKACRSVERAKGVVGKTANLAKCDDTFAAKLVKAEQGIAAGAIWFCRFLPNGDGTVSDLDTGLMWEKKDAQDGVANLANPHDVDNRYFFEEATGINVGASFLGRLNGRSHLAESVEPGFAGYRDWRLPTLLELQSIVDTSVVYGNFVPCGSIQNTPCIQESVFGPTVMCFSEPLDNPCRYHTATVDTAPGPNAYANDTIDFATGGPRVQAGNSNAVRAVRGGGE